MKTKKVLVFSVCAATLLGFGATAFVSLSNNSLLKGLHADSVWNHYSAQAATPVEFGTKEYWVACGGTYQLTAPEGATIVDKVGRPDTSEFTEDDPRWDKTLADYNVGGGTDADLVGAYFTNGSTYTYDKIDAGHFLSGADVGYTHSLLEYNPFDTFTWEIGLPRFNFAARNSLLKIEFKTINWAGNGVYALTEEGLTNNYITDNSITGTIYAQLIDDAVYVAFSSNGNVLRKTITDQDVINGKASITLYAKNNSNGNAYFGITALNAAADESELQVAENIIEATANVTGKRQLVNVLTGATIGDPYDYYLDVGYLWFNDCSGWAGNWIIQLSINQPFAAETHIKPLANTNIQLIRGDETYTYDLSRYSKDLMSYDTTNKQFAFNNDWFKYGVFGTTSWNGDHGLQNGDVLYFQGSFAVVDNDGNLSGGGFTMKKTGVRFTFQDGKYYDTAFQA